ncbi:hypothetical protein Glove_208g75 [Diversispora epigaea]|uniref:N-glycosylase/DNA lyase n=1 Tax=Diversispora epigaea TaxID=1348612 RepID=A0A397IJ77_9GLOM|nr:hypothetical protein Glove_208g75 [Diversispora epigaea]
MSVWRSLKVGPEELRLDTTLKSGQAFRWKLSAENEWSCAFKGKLITLRQTATSIEYKAYFPTQDINNSSSLSVEKQQQRLKMQEIHEIKGVQGIQGIQEINEHHDDEEEKIHEFLWDYFQLNVNLKGYYNKWSSVDGHFAKIANQFQGIRILRQDPMENLFCFICSTNNNITRITQMIEKLCRKYGKKVYTLNDQEYYDFPVLEKLALPQVENELKQLGFGYRAKYIAQTTKILMEKYLTNEDDNDGSINGSGSGGEQWLHSLRKLDYKEAHEALLQLTGVGPKVADCVCLMSLDKHNAIPVDTHVWQIAKREYGFNSGNKGSKTLTSRAYEAVGNHFRKLFGDYSGWAHSVLFTADLKAFENRQQKKISNISKNGLKTLTAADLVNDNNKRRRRS